MSNERVVCRERGKGGAEPLLEPLLRRLRIGRIVPVLRSFPGCRLLDIGCGWEARFLQEVAPHIASGVGIDAKAPELHTPVIRTLRQRMDSTLPFADASFDVVTMLAVLEHLEQLDAMVDEVFRVLRPGGCFCGTVPSQLAKPVLEFLSFRLHIVNPEEIRDHKRYFTRTSLMRLLQRHGFTDLRHSYFQCFMNNFFQARKGQPAGEAFPEGEKSRV